MVHEGIKFGEKLNFIVHQPYDKEFRKIFRYHKKFGAAQEVDLGEVQTEILKFIDQFARLEEPYNKYCLSWVRLVKLSKKFIKDYTPRISEYPSVIVVTDTNFGEAWMHDDIQAYIENHERKKRFPNSP